jgi:hypothetical protein
LTLRSKVLRGSLLGRGGRGSGAATALTFLSKWSLRNRDDILSHVDWGVDEIF